MVSKNAFYKAKINFFLYEFKAEEGLIVEKDTIVFIENVNKEYPLDVYNNTLILSVVIDFKKYENTRWDQDAVHRILSRIS